MPISSPSAPTAAPSTAGLPGPGSLPVSVPQNWWQGGSNSFFYKEYNPDADFLRNKDPYNSVRPNPAFYGGQGGFNTPTPGAGAGTSSAPGSSPASGTKAGGGLSLPISGGGNQSNPAGAWIVEALSRDGVWVAFSYPGYLAETPNLKNYAPVGTNPGRQDLYLGSRLVYSTFYQVNPNESFRPIRSRFVANPALPPGPATQDPDVQRRKPKVAPPFISPGAFPGVFPSGSPGRGRSTAPAPGNRTSPSAPPVFFPAPAPIGNPPPAVAPAPPARSPAPRTPGAPAFPGAQPLNPPATQIPAGTNQNRKVGFPPSLLIPPPVPATPPNGAPIKNGAPQPQPQPNPTPTSTPNYNCQADPCITAIRGTQAQHGQKLDGIVDKLNLLGQTADLALLGVINSKLGPQIPGGISTKLQNFARSTRLDKIINALTLIGVLHNAAMLSTNLAQSLGDVTSTALSAIGIKDDDNNPLDINEILGNAANDFMKGLLGADLWNGIVLNFKKLNRIVTTASNLMWTVRSMFDSAREIQEWTAENTGKIGNAMKRWRLLPENAFPWMPEKVNHGTGLQKRWDRIRDGLDDLDDAASSLQGVLSEVNSIQDEFRELKEQKDNFDAAVKDFTPKERPNNIPVKSSADSSDAVSVSPTVSNPDRSKFEP